MPSLHGPWAVRLAKQNVAQGEGVHRYYTGTKDYYVNLSTQISHRHCALLCDYMCGACLYLEWAKATETDSKTQPKFSCTTVHERMQCESH